jgi:hypothetical protein
VPVAHVRLTFVVKRDQTRAVRTEQTKVFDNLIGNKKRVTVAWTGHPEVGKESRPKKISGGWPR